MSQLLSTKIKNLAQNAGENRKIFPSTTVMSQTNYEWKSAEKLRKIKKIYEYTNINA